MKKMFLYFLFTLSFLFFIFFAHPFFFRYSFFIEKIPEDVKSSRGLYYKTLGDDTLYFAVEKKEVQEKIEGFKQLHQSDFWNPLVCADMVSSDIFSNLFFVEKKLEIKEDGTFFLHSNLYVYSKKNNSLIKINLPLPIEKIFKKDNKLYALKTYKNLIAFLFVVDLENKKISLNDFILIPKNHFLDYTSYHLKFCTLNKETCLSKKEYYSLDSFVETTKKRDVYGNIIFTNKLETLFIPQNTKSLFLIY
jgi:hypothetical protein